MTVQILTGDCRDVLRTLPDESVHCCVTSPPYWGLRDYGVEPSIWGGDATCPHDWDEQIWYTEQNAAKTGIEAFSKPGAENAARLKAARWRMAATCKTCGAWRGAFGLEPNPELFVAHAVEVFQEVHRVLRPDGTLWLNLGDSYARDARKGQHKPGDCGKQGYIYDQGGGRASACVDLQSESRGSSDGKVGRGDRAPVRNGASGLKAKDLIGIPWMVAFALRADGWYLRQDIIWCLSGGAWLYARTPTKIGPMMLKDLTRLAPGTVELWNGERWTRVTAWTRRQGRADAVEIVLRSGERIGCTNNHVWPTHRGNVRTDELQIGDVIRSTLLPDGERQQGWVTDEAFWFAGLYLAEGSRSGETIQISGHTREAEERLRRLRALVSHYGGSARAYTTGNTHNIHIDSIGISAVLRSLIAGKTAKDKRLSSSAWHYPNWQLRQIVEGYLHGDGHLDGDRVRLGFCRNYDLERNLRCLAARLGATLTLKPTVAKNQSGSFPSFKGEWRWSRSGHHNERDRSEIVEIRNSRARQFWDVTVADDPHLFALASGVLTHNSKPNPMPESVRDRCTKAHEYIFLLSKSERYYYDANAIKEPIAEGSVARFGAGFTRKAPGSAPERNDTDGLHSGEKTCGFSMDGRNKRSVWEVTTQGFSEAHFATFPPGTDRAVHTRRLSKRGNGARSFRRRRHNGPCCRSLGPQRYPDRTESSVCRNGRTKNQRRCWHVR